MFFYKFHIFNKFPYANVYANRVEEDIPGEVVICGNGKDQRYVVNLMGQFYPGGYSNSPLDDEKARRNYFYKGLLTLAQMDLQGGIAFNHRIGCGIAGGDWTWYKGTIVNFSKYVWEDQSCEVAIYQREGDV